MGLCSKRFGYEGPAVGAWAAALALQMALGVILVLVGYNDQEMKTLLDKTDLNSSNYQLLMWVGVAHVVVSICVGIIVALGLFVSSCFLIPLCVISILQGIFLLITSGICAAAYMTKPRVIKIKVFDEPAHSLPELRDVIMSKLFGGYFLAGVCLSLGALAANGRASSMKNDTPILEAQLYLPIAVLLVVNGSIFAVGGAGQSPTIPLACIWYACAVGLAMVIGIANCCCTPKIFNAVVGAAFAGIALFGFITCGLTANIYKSVISEYREISFLPDVAIHPPHPLPSDWKLFYLMGRGSYLLAVSATSLATGVLATFAACYDLRSVFFCFGKGDTA